MTADGIIAEADRLIELHSSDSFTDRKVRDSSYRARRSAMESLGNVRRSAHWLTTAEIAHRGLDPVKDWRLIYDRILNGVS